MEGSHQNDFINHNEFDLTFKRFKDTFGSIDFVWTQTLDLLGMSDFMVIFDPKASRRYVKIGKKEQTNDMSKGGGEVRDAKRWIHQEADSVALRGYNSILVGPADKIAKIATESLNAIISAKELPKNPSKGMKVALTQNYTLRVLILLLMMSSMRQVQFYTTLAPLGLSMLVKIQRSKLSL